MRSKEEIQTLKTSFRMPYDILHQVRFIWFFCGISRQTVKLIKVFSYITEWLVNINNLVPAIFNMLARSKSFENICFFNRHYEPVKIRSHVSFPMIEYL